MKNFVKENMNKVIIVYLLLSPIIDIITSVLLNYFHVSFTLGMVVRLSFVIFIMWSTIYVYNKKNVVSYYILVLIYFGLYLISIFKYKSGIVLFSEIQGLIKTFYFPTLLLSLYNIRDDIVISWKPIFYSSAIYIVLVFFPMLFNIGYESYKITKEGTVGFFNSANEISGIISITTPFLFLLLKNKINLMKIIYMIIYMIVILNIGTKTPILAFILSVCLVLVWIIKKLLEKNKKKLIFAIVGVFIVLISSIIIILPKTTFYKNIKVHLEYLGINNVEDILKNPYNIDHFIFSQRLTFLSTRNKQYIESSIYEKIVGIGYNINNKKARIVEIDYCDVFYSHGIIGAILFFSPYLYVLFNKLNKEKKDYFAYIKKISIFLICVLSFFTGHIIISPSVSTFAALIILVSCSEIKDSDKIKKMII